MSKSDVIKIEIPSGLEVSFNEGVFSVFRGSLTHSIKLNFNYSIDISDTVVEIIAPLGNTKSKMYTMTLCAMIKKMFYGLTSGFKKELKIEGVGYKANVVSLNDITCIRFLLGYSHSIFYKVPEGVSVAINRNTIILTSHDDQILGDFASILCNLKKYDVYKKKGILDLSKMKFRRQKSAKKK